MAIIKIKKWVRYDERHGEYFFTRRYKGRKISKSRKKIEEIEEISDLIDQYIKLFDELPYFGNERMTIDYNSLLGKTFGELKVMGVVLINNQRMLYCHCSCGKEVYYKAFGVINGKKKSCGHLEGQVLKTRNAELKEIQRSIDKPLSTNKTTGHKNISYNKNKNAYDVEFARFGVRLRKRFKTLAEAVAFKKEVIADIKRNGGRIPNKYL
jgi:putative DNA-binding phage protein|nr:MAG TPA: hypothetical protein [Caudoviricetes sp.]